MSAYPPLEPYRTGRLRVSDVHELYFEESGDPAGRPVVVLHGGPGFGSDASDRRLFDPARYRIVLYDQRGAGRSTPAGSLVDNTTPHLVGDLEKLRAHLAIDRWQVFGVHGARPSRSRTPRRTRRASSSSCCAACSSARKRSSTGSTVVASRRYNPRRGRASPDP